MRNVAAGVDTDDDNDNERGHTIDEEQSLVNDPLSASLLDREPGIQGKRKAAKTIQGASACATGLNMLNELEGSGLLGLPYAVRLCGWGAFACLGVVGVLAGFTGYLLAMCMYSDAGFRTRVRDTYHGVGEACYGATGSNVVKADNSSFYTLDLALTRTALAQFDGTILIEINPPPPVAGTILFDWKNAADRALIEASEPAAPCVLRLVEEAVALDDTDFHPPLRHYIDQLRGRGVKPFARCVVERTRRCWRTGRPSLRSGMVIAVGMLAVLLAIWLR